MDDVKIISMTESDLGKIQMFCGHSPIYRRGYEAKMEWLQVRLAEGMRYMLLQVNGYNAGLIEYIPGEYAWRGVGAQGYLFIHCLWVIGRNRGHGYGRILLESCLADARGTNGVAVVVSKSHWLPTPKLFLKNGFEPADQAGPSSILLARRINPDAALPLFKKPDVKVPWGLTVYHSDQCPYTQNVPDITMKVGEQLHIPVNIIRVESARAAQQVPCSYGTLAYFYNGEFLEYRPAGTKKLLELLEPKLAE